MLKGPCQAQGARPATCPQQGHANSSTGTCHVPMPLFPPQVGKAARLERGWVRGSSRQERPPDSLLRGLLANRLSLPPSCLPGQRAKGKASPPRGWQLMACARLGFQGPGGGGSPSERPSNWPPFSLPGPKQAQRSSGEPATCSHLGPGEGPSPAGIPKGLACYSEMSQFVAGRGHQNTEACQSDGLCWPSCCMGLPPQRCGPAGPPAGKPPC